MIYPLQALMAEAIKNFENGNLDEAKKLLNFVLSNQPKNFDALHLQGIINGMQGKPKDAQQFFKRALKIDPNHALLNFNMARSLSESGDDARAVSFHLHVLKQDPQNWEAWLNYGIALDNLKKHQEALNAFDKALEINPGLDLAWFNKGDSFFNLKRHDEALAAYDKAIEMWPEFADAWLARGQVLHALKRFDRAIESYDKVLKINPDSFEAWSNRGNSLNALKNFQQGLESCEKAISIAPHFSNAWINRGNSLKELRRHEDALESYRKAVSLDSKLFEAWMNQGTSLALIGRHQEALDCFRTALRLNPDLDIAWCNLLFNSNYLVDQKAEIILQEAIEFGRRLSKRASQKFTHDAVKHSGKLRIGFVSADFHKHPVGYFFEGLLANIDRSKFDVYLYSASAVQDELSEQLRQSATQWCPIHDWSDSQAAELIHGHAIHVLIDLAGYTDGNRLPVFAFKPAPVQATWLGFPFTTGLPEMDYVIGDPYALAPSYEKQFTEKPCRLPEIYLALQLKEETLKKRTPPKLAEHGIAFASFNNLLKMNDKVVNCWAQILHALPDASLTLKASQLADPWFRDQTTQRFRAHGIAPDRLTLMGYIQSHAEHLKSYGQIDIALDPFPYPGVTTSAEAIAMGVPVLSMRGHHFLSSTATSIAHHAGLDTWVADDVEDYVEKAVRFASDRQALLEFRTRLFNQAGHQPLFNVEKFAQDFGLALMQMWSERAA